MTRARGTVRRGLAKTGPEGRFPQGGFAIFFNASRETRHMQHSSPLRRATGCAAAALAAAALLAPATAAASQTITKVYITWYGFNDNSCNKENQHNCNTIAYPKSDGFPTVHNVATEGSGAYDSPVTFATAANDSGGNAEFAPGTILYVPMVRKYFVMEDQCAECITDWKKKEYHVDLWMGPSYEQNAKPLYACEDKLTQGNGPGHGTGTIIVNPAHDLPVDTTPLYLNGKCTTHIYPN
jgi:hypothetical protein